MQIDEIQQRLDQIERENLFLKRAGAGALILVWITVALSLLAGALHDDRVEAQQFTLADAAGEPRAILAHGGDGGFYLIFHDDQQRERAVFGVTGKGRPVLGVMGSDEKARLAFEVADVDAPQLGLFDAEHRLRAALKVTAEGQPKLSLLDENHKRRAVIRLSTDGEAEVVFFDEHEQPRKQLPAGSGNGAP